jgi:uncharacterized protein with HEPN domain
MSDIIDNVDAIAASGNIYRHEYEAVDEVLIWRTVQHDLAELRSVVTAEFDRSQPSS